MQCQRQRLPVFFLAFLTLGLAAVPSLAKDKLERKLERAAEAYQELFDEPDRAVPDYLLERAECIAVFPGVIKGAIGWGGRHGRGVVSCRNGGKWSPPAFFSISGGSVGFQIGAEATDIVLFFVTERSAKSLLKSEFTLGGQLSVSAGPAGRTAEVATDGRLSAEIYSYAKSRGLFAGASLEGAAVSALHKVNQDFYGQRLWPEQILFEQEVRRVPAAAKAFRRVLP